MKKRFIKFVASILLSAFISMSMPAVCEETTPTVKGLYKGSVQTNIEHLPTYRKTQINTVSISDTKATINQGNVMKIAFAEKFSTKTAKVGDKVDFVLKSDLKTQEGRILFPAGTKIIGTVATLSPTKVWNRNAQVLINLDTVVLPDGTTGKISAKMSTKNAVLKRNGWAATGKAAVWTVGLFGVGAGLGAAIGAAASAAGIGCLAIGMPVGGGLGLIIGSLTKGLDYTA